MTISDTYVRGGTPVPPSLPSVGQSGAARPATGVTHAFSFRDVQASELGAQSSTVNALRVAASALGWTATDAGGADAVQLTLPPLPPMPAPAKPPAAATDDHGQSNIVFSSDDADGSLIH